MLNRDEILREVTLRICSGLENAFEYRREHFPLDRSVTQRLTPAWHYSEMGMYCRIDESLLFGNLELTTEDRLLRVCVLLSLPVTNWHFLSTWRWA
jgi:hypothetical protein